MGRKVLVAVSGGVDSTASLLFLHRAGYDCAAATLWLQGDAPAEDASLAADALHLPFFVFDERERFARDVMDAFVADYCAGRTPNPCIVCNRQLKFGAFFDRAVALGYDAIATGHYARVDFDEASGKYRLLRGADRTKDQSYILYALTQAQLSHLLLPLGAHSKAEVRQAVADAGFANAQKKDSQDICFVPDGDYVRFLRDYGGVVPHPGNFVDKRGAVLGRHEGLVCYTTGQRKGLGVSADRPLYVLSKNGSDNTVLLGDDAELFSDTLTASCVNWIAGAVPDGAVRCTAKTRYSQTESEATVTPASNSTVRVVFDRPQRAITAGQSVVFYDGEVCLGGGVIDFPE